MMSLRTLGDALNKKRALILCHGEPPSAQLLRQEADAADVVFCCDGAAEYAWQAGIAVDLLIGDFDSLGQARSKELAAAWGCERMEWPERKDRTDSQLAADIAMADGCKDLVFLGGLGGRFDHAMANATMMAYCKLNGAEAVVKDAQNVIYATCTHLFVPGRVGDFLSVIPLGVNVQVRTTLGLEYPMYDRDLQLGDSYSVSNRFTEEQAYVELAHGWALVIHSWDLPKE